MEDQLRQVAKPQEPLKLTRKGLAMSTPGYHTPSKVVVIGGGYAGTVAANHLRMRADVDITLVNPRPEFVERIRLHQFVAEPGEATMNYGIWTAGFGVPELAAASGLLTDELGRLLTDETLTSVDDGRIIAAGDAAAPPGRRCG
jgi:NADH dehydrogenase